MKHKMFGHRPGWKKRLRVGRTLPPLSRSTKQESAAALGFKSVAAMEEHGRWLDAHGSKEFKAWKQSIVNRKS